MAKKKTEEPHDETPSPTEVAMRAIEAKFGAGSITRLGANPGIIRAVSVIPTGSIALDRATGIGGYPKGRIIEIFGPESSGKTTLTLHAVREAQKAGGVAAFVDAEHALDVEYARALGVNTDEMLVSQPDTGEQALEIVDMLAKGKAADIIVVDSVAALTPKAEIEGEMGDSHVGLQARMMSQAMRKLTAAVSTSGTLVIFINQIRMKIGVMFGSPETTTGGNALKFYASMRLDIRQSAPINEQSGAKGRVGSSGYQAKVKVVKNKMAPPFKEALVPMKFGEGVWIAHEVLALAKTAGMIEASGSWYSYEGQRLGNGEGAARDFLEENPDLLEKIRKAVLADSV